MDRLRTSGLAENRVPSAEIDVASLPTVRASEIGASERETDLTEGGLAAMTRGDVSIPGPSETADDHAVAGPVTDRTGSGAAADETQLALPGSRRADRPEPVVARDYWVSVASSGSADAPDARRRLQELSLDGTPEEVSEALDLLVLNDEAVDADYVDSINALIETGAAGRAADWTDRYLASGFSPRRGTDELLYLLARSLEQPGVERDLRRSLFYYELLMARYPVSRFWEPSRQRAEYLNRHYFEVR